MVDPDPNSAATLAQQLPFLSAEDAAWLKACESCTDGYSEARGSKWMGLGHGAIRRLLRYLRAAAEALERQATEIEEVRNYWRFVAMRSSRVVNMERPEPSMSADLKPCPFCGSPAEYDSRRWKPGGAASLGFTGHSVYCSSSGCNAENGLHETEEEAVEAWNQRAALRACAVESEEVRAVIDAAREMLHKIDEEGYHVNAPCADLRLALERLAVAGEPEC